MHTTESMQICIEEIENGDFPGFAEVPSGWTNWPVQGFFFEGPLAQHWQPLLAIGNIDNEPLALQVSFYDKLIKLRELMINVFGTVEEYRAAALAAKNRQDQELRDQYGEFKVQARAALRVNAGLLGHMCSIAENDEEIWNLFIRVIKRDVVVAEGKKRKGGASGPKAEAGAKGFKPMNSANDLIPFFVLPDADKKELLEDIVAGRLTLPAAKKVADSRITESRALREVERVFNDFMGQKNKSRAVGKGKWISYDKIVKCVPTVPGQLMKFQVAFSKARLVPMEREKFNTWIKK